MHDFSTYYRSLLPLATKLACMTFLLTTEAYYHSVLTYKYTSTEPSLSNYLGYRPGLVFRTIGLLPLGANLQVDIYTSTEPSLSNYLGYRLVFRTILTRTN